MESLPQAVRSVEVHNLEQQYKDGKFLIFRLDGELYGVELIRIQEIIGMIRYTRVPRMPYFVRGVINMRGVIIPILDVRLVFDLGEREYDERTCIIIVQNTSGNEKSLLGLIVDEVSEVEDIERENLLPPPALSSDSIAECIQAMAKIEDDVALIVDVAKLYAVMYREIREKAVTFLRQISE